MQECKPQEYNVNKQDGDDCAVGNLGSLMQTMQLQQASSQVKQLQHLQPSGQAGWSNCGAGHARQIFFLIWRRPFLEIRRVEVKKLYVAARQTN